MNTEPIRKIVDEINQECPGSIDIQKQTVKIFTVDQEIQMVDKRLETQQTALYTCRINKLYNQWRKWVSAFPTITPYYAVKCNPGIPVIKFLAKLGVNFDCATMREIEEVLRCGVSPDRIIYAHPVKHPKHLERCKELGVKFSVVDSPEEVLKIKKYFPEMVVLVRLKIGNKKSKIELSDKFGATLENAMKTIDACAENQINLDGICFHVGYYNTDIYKYTDALEFTKDVRDHGVSKGFAMKTIDIGGGFLSYNIDGYNFDQCANEVTNALTKFFGKEIEEKKINLISEPGTFFVDNCHNAYFKIIRQFVETVDGVETQHIFLNDSYYSTLSNYFEDYAEISLSSLDEGKEFKPPVKTIVHGGSMDGTFDKKHSALEMPHLENGEWLFAEFIGAYSLALCSDFFIASGPSVVYYMTEK